MKIVNQAYLLQLYSALEKIKQAQLGLDNESRIEYRKLEQAVKNKIKEVEKQLHQTKKEIVV
jgi:hypothetical protein